MRNESFLLKLLAFFALNKFSLSYYRFQNLGRLFGGGKEQAGKCLKNISNFRSLDVLLRYC